jgi:tRNA/tmRNA/rRNA uracil-C5-methylase (TrmA/RlmC/RlmD family)
MSEAITFDDLEAGYYEAAAAASRTKAAVQRKRVTLLTILADLWSVNRALKHLVEMYNKMDFRLLAGAACQRCERDLTNLIHKLDELVALCRQKGLNNRKLTGGVVSSLTQRTEELKDTWVMLSSSTDAELEDALAKAAEEESVPWETLWR